MVGVKSKVTILWIQLTSSFNSNEVFARIRVTRAAKGEVNLMCTSIRFLELSTGVFSFWS